MKFTAKNNEYRSIHKAFGVFPNAFIKDFKKTIVNEVLIIYFALFYELDGEIVKVENEKFHMQLTFDQHQNTMVLDFQEEGIITTEISEFLANGGDLNGKEIDWKIPGFYQCKKFFENDLLLPEINLDPNYKIISVPGLLNLIQLEGVPIIKNFEYAEE